MSKAFTKEDAWEEPVVPPRAPLPAGVPNYVTPRGMALLRDEHAALEAERQQLDALRSDDLEQRRRRAIIAGRLRDLNVRISSAEVVHPRPQHHDRVRFGAQVTLRTVSGPRAGEQRRLEIVGVDEADAAHDRIAFVAPIARALIGCAVGDTASLHTPRGEEQLEVVAIEYGSV